MLDRSGTAHLGIVREAVDERFSDYRIRLAELLA
jgi:hypothetical protein